MKKFIVASLCLFSAFVCLTSAPLEARRHCRSSTSVSFGVATQARNNVYVVRQYPQPMQTVVYTPQPYYAVPPQYYAPTYIVQPAPTYVEEVYVSRPCPSLFSGLSFSWNFGR